MIAIGIDLSINCTGVCIIDDSKKRFEAAIHNHPKQADEEDEVI